MFLSTIIKYELLNYLSKYVCLLMVLESSQDIYCRQV